MRLGGLFLAGVVLLAACQTDHRLLTPVVQPSSEEARLASARQQIQAGELWKAWVLLVNNPSESEPQTVLLRNVESQLLAVWNTLGADPAKLRKANEWQRSLADAQLLPAPDPIVEPVPAEVGSGGPADWLKGTVTVIVNRGLKLERGTASPDILIGSGFFVDPSGLVLTNEHVIDAALEPGTPTTRVSIRMPGSKGERIPAKVLGWDKNHDLALLKVEFHPDYVFQFSNKGIPQPGQRLQALGSPGGLESTLTEGIVSALKRPLLPMGDVFQVDVAVNPGNSGGPLVDSSGKVVGIVFAGIQEFQGVNFAIPSTVATKLLPRLKTGGKAVIPWLGLGLQEDFKGLEVVYVLPQGPSDWAGIRKGDRLVALAGQSVSEIAQAQAAILDFGIDSTVKLGLERGGKVMQAWVSLAARPEEPLKVAVDSDLVANLLPLAFGIDVDDVGTPVDRSFRVARVLAGTDGEELQLSANDPLTVLDWKTDTDHHVLVCRVMIKRRIGGYFEMQVQLAAPLALRQFL